MKVKTFFDVKFNEEFLDKISNIITEAEPNEQIQIYYSSYGGKTWICESVIDIINSHKERIELIGFGSLYSCGFILMMEAKCKKRIIPNTVGMTHQTNYPLDFKTSGKPNFQEDKFLVKKHLPFAFKKDIEIHKNYGLNKKELKDYKNGSDVFFTYDRFIELLNNTK